MSHYDAADPLTVLRAEDLPVQPDPAFAARLRARLEESMARPGDDAEVKTTVTSLRGPWRNGSAAAKKPWGARTIKLRTAVAAALVGVLLVGFGGVLTLGQRDISASTSDSRPPASDGLVGGADTRTESGIAADENLPRQAPSATGAPAPAAPPPLPQDATTVAPDIITTGSMRMVVDEPVEVADRLVSAVTDAGGRVDERSDQTGSSSPSVNLVLRIPSAQVDAVVDDAKNLGDVESMSIENTDVTSQRVDLDARIDALQTSVNRLRELMGKAGDLADLLAAESSLTQRQAELDSLRAQRAELGDDIAYATISVHLAKEPTAPPRVGFFGALERGWQSLITTIHGVIVTAGFLLPWIPVLGVLGLGLYFLVRRRRKA